MMEERRAWSRRLVRCALAGLASALLLGCATAPAGEAEPPNTVTSSGTWTFAFDAGPGLASATLSDQSGVPQIRVTCTAPNGAVNVQDWAFTRTRQGPVQAMLSLGDRQGAYAGTVSGDGAGRQALTFQVPAKDRILNGLLPSVEIHTAVAGFTHIWAPGAASRLNDVINSCHTIGS